MRTQTENKQKAQSEGNAGDQVVAGCSLASDWLRKWREFSTPIT